MQLQLEELQKYAQGVAACELENTGPGGFDKIDKKNWSKPLPKNRCILKKQTGKQTAKTKVQLCKEALACCTRQILATGKYRRRQKKLYQNRYRCNVHAYEGIPHKKRSIKSWL